MIADFYTNLFGGLFMQALLIYLLLGAITSVVFSILEINIQKEEMEEVEKISSDLSEDPDNDYNLKEENTLPPSWGVGSWILTALVWPLVVGITAYFFFTESDDS